MVTLPIQNSRKIKLKILVYRRTHTGDPNNKTKTFGINDCMGSVRDWEYDAVIGIGGSKPDEGDEGIREKITWVGITPKLKQSATKEDVARMMAGNPNFSGFRGQLVTFEKFKSWDENGKSVRDNYPNLYQYMFDAGRIPRAALNFPDRIYEELLKILEMAENEIDIQSRTNIPMTTVNSVDSTCRSASEKKHKGCA